MQDIFSTIIKDILELLLSDSVKVLLPVMTSLFPIVVEDRTEACNYLTEEPTEVGLGWGSWNWGVGVENIIVVEDRTEASNYLTGGTIRKLEQQMD